MVVGEILLGGDRVRCVRGGRGQGEGSGGQRKGRGDSGQGARVSWSLPVVAGARSQVDVQTVVEAETDDQVFVGAAIDDLSRVL